MGYQPKIMGKAPVHPAKAVQSKLGPPPVGRSAHHPAQLFIQAQRESTLRHNPQHPARIQNRELTRHHAAIQRMQSTTRTDLEWAQFELKWLNEEKGVYPPIRQGSDYTFSHRSDNIAVGPTVNEKLLDLTRQAISTMREGPKSSNVDYMEHIMIEVRDQKVGNCSELCWAIVYGLGGDGRTTHVEVVALMGTDHVFVVLGRPKQSDLNDISTWGDTAAICDPWANIACLAKDYVTQWQIRMNEWTEMQWLVHDKQNWIKPNSEAWLKALSAPKKTNYSA